MLKVVDGHLTTEALILNRDNSVTIAGVTAEKWQRKYEVALSQNIEDYDPNRKPEGYLEAPLAYGQYCKSFHHLFCLVSLNLIN